MPTLIGNVIIQPASSSYGSQQQTTAIAFLSNDSGSYIHGGTNPITGIGPKTGSLTFSDNGSIYTFIFSGSEFVTGSGYPGTVISASIDGLTTSGSIINAFTASIAANTTMTASKSGGNTVLLKNNSFQTASYTTSSFSNQVLFVQATVVGSAGYTVSGSTTTGSLEISGSFRVSGSLQIPSSSVPSGTGEPGQILVAAKGSDHFIFAYVGGAWKSASLF